MLAKLNMNTLACLSDAGRMMKRIGPAVSGLYRISGVNGLLAEQKAVQLCYHAQIPGPRWIASRQYHGTPEHAIPDGCPLEGLSVDPTSPKSKFVAEKKPNNKHHKMYRQFSKPQSQTPGEYSGDYYRAISVEGDDRRYNGLDTPKSDGLFAAYDPLDIRNAKYLIGASSDTSTHLVHCFGQI